MGLKKCVSLESKWPVIGMKKADLSNPEIGRQLGRIKCSVRTTLNNFNETRTLADKPRPGAPKKLSDRDENAMYRLSRLGPSNSCYRRIKRDSQRSPSFAKHRQQTVAQKRSQFVSCVQEAVVDTIKSHQTLKILQKASGLVGRTLEDGNLQRISKW